jgi:calmodulin-lysine N-methyltransferase
MKKGKKSTNRHQNLSNNSRSSFNLFSVRPLPHDATWHRYTLINGTPLSVEIPLPSRKFTVEDLTGFNNTGNVRIWPSEEVLAYMVLQHCTFFENKTVLEVGGGMSCLAGVLLAQRAQCQVVHLTDGNAKAIANVREIVKRNRSTFRCLVSCDILMWNEYARQQADSYDAILAADCLFFDDSRTDLIRLMAKLVRPNGFVFIAAPRRGSTLSTFVKEVRSAGFRCSVHHYYDEYVWSQHTKLKEDEDYVEDTQYPLLLILKKES